MNKIISFMHMSLDGYVAGPNGEMNWIKVDETLFDYIGQRIATTDRAMYGRVTYQMMEGYWPTAGDAPDASKHDKQHAQWYNTAHKIVLSKTMHNAQLPNTTVVSGNLRETIHQIKQAATSEILLFGSPAATHTLMHENLVDGFWLFVNPIILGQGIPLFNKSTEAIPLDLVSPVKQFSNGVTELNYLVKRS